MIRIENVSKTFQTTNGEVNALKNVSISIDDGDIFGIIGLSGAGKSTLVRCINLLEKPTQGEVFLGDVELTSLKQGALRNQRRKIGMSFQQFNLLSQRTALKNVCFPLELEGYSRKDAKARAEELLDLVGLSDRKKSYPSQLSGGQKQRVAIARALATNPQVLLCDEATSALDPETTRSILELLKEINERLGVTIIVITHEMKVIEQICHKVAVLEDGEVAEQGPVKDIFISPKSQIAQKLIIPEGKIIREMKGSNTLRIVFDGQSSNEPVIANMILQCKAPVNILGASTEDIQGKAYGQMILQLPEDEIATSRIKQYLESAGIHFEEGDTHGI